MCLSLFTVSCPIDVNGTKCFVLKLSKYWRLCRNKAIHTIYQYFPNYWKPKCITFLKMSQKKLVFPNSNSLEQNYFGSGVWLPRFIQIWNHSYKRSSANLSENANGFQIVSVLCTCYVRSLYFSEPLLLFTSFWWVRWTSTVSANAFWNRASIAWGNPDTMSVSLCESAT